MHRFRRRADELDFAIAADLGEVSVLRQKAVAGMNGLHVGGLGSANEAGHLWGGLCRRGRADADFLLGQVEGRRAAVRLAVRGARLDAPLLSRAEEPQGELSP